MAAGCGVVILSGACASCAMLLRSILARMASRGAARRAQSAQMRRIATLMGLGNSTGAITCSSSTRRYILVVFSWCRLSLANAVLGNNKSAGTAVCSAANANFTNAAVHLADSRQSHLHALSANAFSHVAALWGRHLFALLQCCSLASSANAFSHVAVSWQRRLSRMAASSLATSAAVSGGEK